MPDIQFVWARLDSCFFAVFYILDLSYCECHAILLWFMYVYFPIPLVCCVSKLFVE